MRGIYLSPVAKQIPFDNSTNGFPASATNVQSAIENVIHFDPNSATFPNFDDFDNRMPWSPATTGGGAASVSLGNATHVSGKHCGVARIATATLLGSSGCLQWSATLTNAFALGFGEATYETLVYLPITSTVAVDFTFRAGLGTSSTSTDHAQGVYFQHDATSANWLLKTANNNTRTTTTSSIAVAAATWTSLRWESNSAGTQVDFYVNDVLAGSNTTNIPTTTGLGCGANFTIFATAVLSASREAFMDYFYFAKVYTARN